MTDLLPETQEIIGRMKRVKGERDRYRNALERIAAQGTHGENWVHWRSIAQEALAPFDGAGHPSPACAQCGHMRDTPQHELGCSAAFDDEDDLTAPASAPEQEST